MFEIILWVLIGMVAGGLIVGLSAWSRVDELEYQYFLDKVKKYKGESYKYSGGWHEPETRIETRGRKKGTTPYKCRRCAGTEYVIVSKQRHCKPCWESSIEKRREYARKWYHANKQRSC